MKAILPVLLISLCILFTIPSVATAVDDATGDNYAPQIDLLGASAQTFYKEGPDAVPSRINLGIKMTPASHLPGLVIWEFDVDSNSSTGGSSLLNTTLPTAEGGGTGPYKEAAGFDLRVVMALRTQAETSDTALCQNCTEDAQSCAMGLVKGEWYATRGDGSTPFMRGSIYLSPAWDITWEVQLCVILPWADMISRAIGDGADFDLNYAKNNPPAFQVSLWHDSAFTDGDDLMDGGSVLNLADFLPNGSLDKANGEYNLYNPCEHNVNGDQNVDAVDVSSFLSEFGRLPYSHYCPSCKYNISDNTEDSYVPQVDLRNASVQTFDREGPDAVPSRINLGIKMASGSHLPGLVIWEFDVDSNSSTGGSSLLNTTLPTAEGGGTGPYKEAAGFDLRVVMALRTQAETSDTALCQNCTEDAQSCAMGLVKGEWYATRGDGSTPFMRGSIYLSPAWDITWEVQLCVILPWADMISRAIGDGADFDLNYAKNNPPAFQVSLWHDSAFTDGDDLMDGGSVLNLADFLPNGSLDKANGEYALWGFCKHNINYDGGVDAYDLAVFLSEFGRTRYLEPCPTCTY